MRILNLLKICLIPQPDLNPIPEPNPRFADISGLISHGSLPLDNPNLLWSSEYPILPEHAPLSSFPETTPIFYPGETSGSQWPEYLTIPEHALLPSFPESTIFFPGETSGIQWPEYPSMPEHVSLPNFLESTPFYPGETSGSQSPLHDNVDDLGP